MRPNAKALFLGAPPRTRQYRRLLSEAEVRMYWECRIDRFGGVVQCQYETVLLLARKT